MPEHFHLPQKGNPVLMSSHSPDPLPQPVAATSPLPAYMDSSVWDSPCKWNHTICGLSRVASFTEHSVFEFLHIVARIRTSFRVTAEQCSPVWISRILCIRSSTDERLTCFHHWAVVVIRAAVSTRAQGFVQTPALQDAFLKAPCPSVTPQSSPCQENFRGWGQASVF